MVTPLLRLHGLIPRSYANGPGARAVVWVQGCTLRCPGCFNPNSHNPAAGAVVPVETLVAQLTAWAAASPDLEGLTISGGEPLQQLPAVSTLLRGVRAELPWTVLLFTGYTWTEVQAMPRAAALLACCDLVIAGRYEAARHLGRGLLGSTNQTVHCLTDRYGPDDLATVPEGEIVVTADGRVTRSGIGFGPFALEPER